MDARKALHILATTLFLVAGFSLFYGVWKFRDISKRIASKFLRVFGYRYVRLRRVAEADIIDFENPFLLRKYEEQAEKELIPAQPDWFISGSVAITDDFFEADLPVLTEEDIEKLKTSGARFKEVHHHFIVFRTYHAHFVGKLPEDEEKLEKLIDIYLSLRW